MTFSCSDREVVHLRPRRAQQLPGDEFLELPRGDRGVMVAHNAAVVLDHATTLPLAVTSSIRPTRGRVAAVDASAGTAVGAPERARAAGGVGDEGHQLGPVG